MDSKTSKFEKIFKSAYSLENFKEFVTEFFKDINWVLGEQRKDYWNWSEFSVFVEGYTHIGSYTDTEQNEISIFAVEMKKGQNIDKARSIQRNFAKKLIESNNAQAAIVAFYSADYCEKWRLSFVKLDYEFAAGKLKSKLTPAKRYSYLVGKGEPCHTAQQRLLAILQNDTKNPTLSEIEEAFSVEKITKEFFEQYKNKYIELKEHLENNDDFMEEAQKHNFTSEQFAKKLMGQIAFLYFVQKKGWLGVNALPKNITAKQYKDLFYAMPSSRRYVVENVYKTISENEYRLLGTEVEKLNDEEEELLAKYSKGEDWGTGPRDFMRKLFDNCSKNNKNYFDDYLEPLFYKALNESRGENAYYTRLHCKVPFLNGGLFEPLDNYDWDNNQFDIDNEMFSNIEEKGEWNATGILDIFDRYNFTMNEDEPLEKEVAVDPEMLGKIFENLLDVKDRKSKGAFYTPREIVHYMCQESLVNYLVNETGLNYDDLKDFILYGEFMKDEDTSRETKQNIGDMLISKNILDGSFEEKNKVRYLIPTVNRLIDIDNALANIKVCDPAVGSGAFPLGMINEIVKARTNITEYLALMDSNPQNRLIMHKGTRDPYRLKLDTIKNSIYAVDIEASAVDITKLRLWLSLVVDAETDPTADEYSLFEATRNPKPLPNLDCNIRCGNSLIDEINGVKLIKETALFGDSTYQTAIGQNVYENILTELFAAQDKLFSEKDHNEKELLKNKIAKIKDHLIMENVKGTVAEAKYQSTKNNASLPYFVWQLEFAKVFKDKGGFDVVIGNPPYIKIQNIPSNEAKILKNNYEVSKGKFDIYILFIELSFKLMKKRGISSFIQPHRFLNVEYASSLRQYLINKRGLSKFIHFGDNQIFETATTYTGVFFYQNNSANIEYALATSKNLNVCNFKIKEYSLLGSIWNFNLDKNNSFLDKIYSQKTNLLQIFEGVYQGIITMGDDIFILNGNIEGNEFYGYSNALKQNIKIEKSLLKPVLKGEDIKRYLQPKCKSYVIYPHIINSKNKTVPLDENDFELSYPLTYKYLENFKQVLIEKKIKYKTNPTYWYSLHRSREIDILNSNKIITPQLQNYPNFAIDTESNYPDAGGYCLIIKKEHKNNLNYYYGILNSNLFWNFIKSTSTVFNNGYYYFKTAYLTPFKFPLNPNIEKQDLIKNLVDQILSAKQTDTHADTSALEAEIDKIVYELYGLTDEEIKIVEESVK